MLMGEGRRDVGSRKGEREERVERGTKRKEEGGGRKREVRQKKND